MVKPSQWFSIYLATITLCFAGSMWWLSRNEQPTPTATEPAVEQERRVLQPLRPPREENLALARDLARLNLTELEKVAKSMRTGFQTDPASTAEFVRDLSLHLADAGEYEQALELAAFLFGIREVPAIERAVFDHWFRRDGEALQSYLAAIAAENLTDDHHISLIASIVQHEHATSLESWTNWISQRPSDDYLRQRFTSKLLFHSHAETAPQVARFIASQPLTEATAAGLPRFLTKYAPDDSADGLRWITSLQGSQEMRSTALAIALADFAQRDPSIARAYSDETRFIADILGQERNKKGLWNPEAQAFHQATLRSTIELLSNTSPVLRDELALRLKPKPSP